MHKNPKLNLCKLYLDNFDEFNFYTQELDADPQGIVIPMNQIIFSKNRQLFTL